MKRAISRVARISRIDERSGEAGRWTLITELEEVEDKEDVLERGGEIRWKWGVGVDEDLMIGERRLRWRIVEAAKRERAKGTRVVAANRELWVEGVKWNWDEEEKRWREKEGG